MTARERQRNDNGGEGGSVLTAAAIAQLTGGRLEGSPDASVSSVASLERAAPGQLSFCGSPKYVDQLASTRASVVLIAPDMVGAPSSADARVVVEKPHDALVGLLPQLYRPPRRAPGVHSSAVVGRGVQIGEGAVIGPFVHIGDDARIGARTVVDAHGVIGPGACIGEDCYLHARVTLYPGAETGNRVIVHSGAVIGSDGFGYLNCAFARSALFFEIVIPREAAFSNSGIASSTLPARII